MLAMASTPSSEFLAEVKDTLKRLEKHMEMLHKKIDDHIQSNEQPVTQLPPPPLAKRKASEISKPRKRKKKRKSEAIVRVHEQVKSVDLRLYSEEAFKKVAPCAFSVPFVCTQTLQEAEFAYSVAKSRSWGDVPSISVQPHETIAIDTNACLNVMVYDSLKKRFFDAADYFIDKAVVTDKRTEAQKTIRAHDPYSVLRRKQLARGERKEELQSVRPPSEVFLVTNVRKLGFVTRRTGLIYCLPICIHHEDIVQLIRKTRKELKR